MNDEDIEDIKEALVCCVIGNCRKCPLDNIQNCRTRLKEGTNNILSQQQLELVFKGNTIDDLNDKLAKRQSENEKLQSLCTSQDAIIKEQQAEIERLKEFITEIVRSDRELKSKAIKECVNKYTEMLIGEYHLRTDLQIANLKRLEQKVLKEIAGEELR